MKSRFDALPSFTLGALLIMPALPIALAAASLTPTAASYAPALPYPSAAPSNQAYPSAPSPYTPAPPAPYGAQGGALSNGGPGTEVPPLPDTVNPAASAYGSQQLPSNPVQASLAPCFGAKTADALPELPELEDKVWDPDFAVTRYVEHYGHGYSHSVWASTDAIILDVASAAFWMGAFNGVDPASYYMHPGGLLYGMACLGISTGIDEYFARPVGAQRLLGVYGSPCSLPGEKAPDLEPFFAKTDASAFYFFWDWGNLGTSNQDQRNYYNTGGLRPAIQSQGRDAWGLGWGSRSGFGMEAFYEESFRDPGAFDIESDLQNIDLYSHSVVISPNWSWMLMPRNGMSLTLGLDLGSAWLSGRNYILNAPGQQVGAENLAAQTFCWGPRMHLSRPIFPWLSWGYEAGYRLCRYAPVQSSGATGSLLGATAGHTWGGKPEVWDFSGPEIGLYVELGKIPFSK